MWLQLEATTALAAAEHVPCHAVLSAVADDSATAARDADGYVIAAQNLDGHPSHDGLLVVFGHKEGDSSVLMSENNMLSIVKNMYGRTLPQNMRNVKI